MPTVVLGVTGCIAAYKACEILRELQRRDLEVRVVMTAHATHFVGPLTFEALSRHPVYTDAFALGERSDMAHISWAEASDLLLVAPATANVLGKFAHGVADDALSTLYLATTAPVVVAPAMNVEMWRHPAVAENLATLRRRGVGIVEPGAGYLACGTIGEGRLADVADIVAAATARLAQRQELAGETVVVTAGPTREPIDAVRFISNRSSGRMGFRMAEAARDRGARVILVSGPTALQDPRDVEVVRVTTAEEMAAAVSSRAASSSIVIMAAAVCDQRPRTRHPAKLRKQDLPEALDLEATPDILKSLGRGKGNRFLVGFAAETNDLVASARRKLAEKQLDLIVANDVSGADGGFDSEKNAATLLDASGGAVEVALTSKRELAERIWDRIGELRRTRAAGPA
jgi:phosphopantothenoylcysteine decarboxylase/phosphopantothenate--cysteine ligase